MKLGDQVTDQEVQAVIERGRHIIPRAPTVMRGRLLARARAVVAASARPLTSRVRKRRGCGRDGEWQLPPPCSWCLPRQVRPRRSIRTPGARPRSVRYSAGAQRCPRFSLQRPNARQERRGRRHNRFRARSSSVPIDPCLPRNLTQRSSISYNALTPNMPAKTSSTRSGSSRSTLADSRTDVWRRSVKRCGCARSLGRAGVTKRAASWRHSPGASRAACSCLGCGSRVAPRSSSRSGSCLVGIPWAARDSPRL